MSRNIKKVEPKCQECGSQNLLEDNREGNLTCMDCGTVVDSLIDEGSEWRTFADSDKAGGDPNRVGAPTNPLFGSGNATTVVQKNLGVNQTQFSKLEKMQKHSNNKDQALSTGISKVNQLCDRMSLGLQVKTRAQLIFKMGHDAKIIPSRGNDAVVGACVYIACKEQNVPRSNKEVLDAMGGNVRQKQVTKFMKELKINMIKEDMGGITKSAHPSDYMNRWLSQLNATDDAKKAGREFAKKAVPEGGRQDDKAKPWDNRHPTTVAGAIVYIVTSLPKGMDKHRHVTIDDIANVTGAAKGTIRDAYKQFQNELEDLIPSWFASKRDIMDMKQNLL